MDSSQAAYDRRMSLVKDIICSFGLKAPEKTQANVSIEQSKSITPVEYVGHSPFPVNNFIYKVTLSSPATKEHFNRAGHQTCAVLPPSTGEHTLIVRLSNPMSMGMNNTNRVENEVSAMAVARTAMAGIEGGRYDAIVPRVYAWKSTKLVAGSAPERGYGWIVMQYMEGEVLDRVFGDMEWHEKKRIVGEIACIFAAFQKAKLPRRVELHGGMTVRDGDIVSGQATMHKGEPSGYVGLWKARIDHALEAADESMLINGWKGSVRERIEKFKNDKLEILIHNGEVDTTLLGIVHNDFTMSNMLYNPHTKRITALLDFDWSSVTHPAHEFFTSFHDVHGRVDETSDKLRRAILSGDFGHRPDEDEDQEAWKLAKTWDEALKGHNGMRPCDVKGMGLLQGLWKFVYCICPFELGSKVILFRRSKKESEAAKVRVEGQISKMLSGWGV